MKCPKNIREKCEAYTDNLGNECWLIPKYDFKGCPAHPDSCFNCPWYKKNKPKGTYWFSSQHKRKHQ